MFFGVNQFLNDLFFVCFIVAMEFLDLRQSGGGLGSSIQLQGLFAVNFIEINIDNLLLSIFNFFYKPDFLHFHEFQSVLNHLFIHLQLISLFMHTFQLFYYLIFLGR